jgi:hypothetical protein
MEINGGERGKTHAGKKGIIHPDKRDIIENTDAHFMAGGKYPIAITSFPVNIEQGRGACLKSDLVCSTIYHTPTSALVFTS